jgi:hypothetical protein
MGRIRGRRAAVGAAASPADGRPGRGSIRADQPRRARIIIASVTYNGTMRVTRGTVVGGIVEVSAQTGRRCGHYSPSARPTPPTPGGTSPTACCHPSTQPATTCSSAAASSAGSTAAGSPHCPATRWPRALPPGDAALDAPSRKAGKLPAPGALACLARSSTGCAPAPDPAAVTDPTLTDLGTQAGQAAGSLPRTRCPVAASHARPTTSSSGTRTLAAPRRRTAGRAIARSTVAQIS